MSTFAESFDQWWNATKQVVGEAVKAAADAAQVVLPPENESERIRMIMDMKKCDEATARAYYAQWKLEQDPSALPPNK
jgi:hypothetical protein